jgi:hypothetical protein
LRNKSYAQIAKETIVSKTAVFNVVHEWNQKVGNNDIDAVKFFLTEVNKSGISVQDCIEGYRTCQLLKAFGVGIGSEAWIEELEAEDNESGEEMGESDQVKDTSIEIEPPIQVAKKSTSQTNVNEKELKINYTIEEFVYDVYSRCISYKIKPDIIIRWILDLFNTFSIKEDDEVSVDTDMGVDDYYLQNTLTNDRKKSEIKGVSGDPDSGIPYVSQVSSFIKLKRIQIKKLDKIKKEINSDISELVTEKDNLVSEISELIRNKNRILSYFKWYEDLKNQLYQRQQIVLNNIVGSMVNIINDFKFFDFDVTRIIKEYKDVNSLITHKANIQNDIEQKLKYKHTLETEITQLDESISSLKQTIHTFHELRKYGIGLKELKNLANTIYELADANDCDIKSPFKKFMKDVEEQYDSKLGFEKIISELEEKKKKLEEDVPEYKSYLRLQGIVAPILFYLQRNGVSNVDIIGMNNLVTNFINKDFLSNPLDKLPLSLTNNDKQNRASFWNLFVSKLQNIKNINIEIQKRIDNIDQLTKQLYELDRKKDQLESVYHQTAFNLNFLSSKLYQIFEMINNIYGRAIPKSFIFLVFSDLGGSYRQGNNNSNKDNIK